MKQTKDVIAYFFIFLIISMPFYTSSVMAATITITKNTGELGIPNFIDAQGDTWTLDVQISDIADLKAEDLTVKIGQLQEPFQSCSENTCSYLSALTDGVVENDYEFQVEYKTTDEFNNPILIQSQPAVIRADGSAPEIILNQQVKQLTEGPIFLDFSVNDKVNDGAPAVGIKTINIIDSDNGNIIQSIDVEGKIQYHFILDGNSEGKLSIQFEGEGIKKLRIEAEDLLGHKTILSTLSVEFDFIKPAIVSESLNFTELGKFIGNIEQTSDLTLDITESNNLLEVLASSPETNLDNTGAGSCTRIDSETWRCTWKNVVVKPQSNIEIQFSITDQFGNKQDQTVNKVFVQDNSPPVLQFFGTLSQFQEVNYMSKGKNIIIVQVQESGSGMNSDGLRLNLGAFGKGSHVEADECGQEGDIFACRWDVNVDIGAGVARVGISEFQDLVGNKGLQVEKEFIIDTGEPAVLKVEISGQDENGKRNFFQSNDVIVFDIEVKEETGLLFTVDMRDLSNDPEVDYPETPLNKAGFLLATEESCQREEDVWVCSFESKPVKSGPISTAFVILHIQDTAGNEADSYPYAKNANKNAGKSGKYKFTLLGLENEENPDFWGVQNVKLLTEFIDLDTTELIPARMPVEITLNSNHSLAKVLKVDLIGCTVAEQQTTDSLIGTLVSEGEEEAPAEVPTATIPTIKKAISYGGITSGGEVISKPTILLEFNQFNGKEMLGLEDVDVFEEYVAEYNCQLRIFSQIGKNSIKNAEIQPVIIPVVFAFSTLGAIDENLDAKIKDITEEALFEIADNLFFLTEIIEWVKYILNLLNGIIIIMEGFQIVTASSSAIMATPAVPAGIGVCKSATTGTDLSATIVDVIQVPMAVLSCNPNPHLGWYSDYQQSVIYGYNLISGRLAIQAPATSLYENYILSVVGLCIPGMLHNLEKYRQVRCREIICLKNEVPQGLATVESCSQLGEYLSCRYFSGAFIEFIPLAGAIDTITNFLKSFLSSPLGYLNVALRAPCYALCLITPAGGGLATACQVTATITKVIDLVDLIVGAIDTVPSKVGNAYCGQVEEIEGVSGGV